MDEAMQDGRLHIEGEASKSPKEHLSTKWSGPNTAVPETVLNILNDAGRVGTPPGITFRRDDPRALELEGLTQAVEAWKGLHESALALLKTKAAIIERQEREIIRLKDELAMPKIVLRNT